MYSVLDFGRMAADAVRMDAYARALARAVRPGSVVVDIGAGTGVFSLLAARAGAKRVHAIDPNPAIFLLPELARENGVGDRIVIHPTTSFEVELPERADVIVSDLRGVSPFHADHVAAIRDARERLLAPGGVLVPLRDRLFVAAVESPGMWRSLARAWESLESRGLSASAVRTSVLNTLYNDTAAPLATTDVLTTPASWGTLDYATYDGAVVDATLALPFVRGGTVHGLALWFEAQVAEGIAYATAPGATLVYARAFLPLLEPVRVEAGETTKLTLRVDARGDRWAWETELSGGRFRQSTFFGAPTSPDALLREASTHRPTLSARGDRTRRVLEAMDGRHTVHEIVEAIATSTPEGALRTALKEEAREAIARYGS